MCNNHFIHISMSGKVTGMSTIKQLLRLHKDGLSIRKISRELKLNRATVTSYIDKLNLHGFDIDELLGLDDPVLESRFIAGHAAYLEPRFEQLKELLPIYEKRLEDKNMTRLLLWQDYIAKHSSGYRYTQFCHHLGQLLKARHPSAILEHRAGEKMFIDFCGDTLDYVDAQTGEMIEVQVFVATLPFSDYAFCMAVPSQRTEDFLYALSCALVYYGGCPKIMVTDNLKSSVIKTDKYEPELNRLMEDFANHYGFVVLPARPYRPKDKSLVENQVKLIYRRVYARISDYTFLSLEELNKALAEMTRKHNQTRMQQKPYSREERFLSEEKSLLGALPENDFEVKFYASLRVAKNNCIYLARDKHYYSVPFEYIGQKTDVIYTRTLVKIYCDKKLVATHRRTQGFGYTTQREHLCSTHNHYNDRSPGYYKRMAGNFSSSFEELIEKMFEDATVPETIFRRCDGLLSLCRKTDPIVFDKVCNMALEHEVYSYQFVKKAIENKMVNYETDECKPLPEHPNIRGEKYFC